MTKTTIAQQIETILQKRHPTVKKIMQSQQSVQSLLDSFSEMETLKEIVDSTPKCNPRYHAASCTVSAKNTAWGVL